MNTRWHWELPQKTSETIQDLWENAVEYFKWCEANPVRPKRTVLVGKEAGKKLEVEFMRPYSMQALILHCGVTEEYILSLRNAPKDSEAYLIVSRIIMNVWVQNYELAAVGEISQAMALKMLKLDKQDEGPQKVIIEHVHGLPALGNSENEILQMIELQNGELKNKD